LEKNLDDLLVLLLVLLLVVVVAAAAGAVAAAAAGMTIMWCPFKAQCVGVGRNQICFQNFPFYEYNELTYFTVFNCISFLTHLSVHCVVINSVKWLILEINYLF
jgi:hypothetical protein